ncbi:hypothetical protein EBR03_06625 [bacterium]|nr:hypothetical protein [bacterium]
MQLLWVIASLVFAWKLKADESLLKVHSEKPLQAEATSGALIPFETPIAGFFIRNHHDVPVVSPEDHVVVVNGLVDNPLRLTLKELREFPQKELYAVLECSGNRRGLQIPSAGGIQWTEGALGNAEWSGPQLKTILEKARVRPEGRFITVRGADEPALPATPAFIRSIPLQKANEQDSILALTMNREPLPLLHGGPVRLVLPRWYGQNWVKWITEIKITAEEDSGFFMRKAYRMPKKPLKVGEPWNSEEGAPIQELLVQSLIVQPEPLEWVASGKVTVRGKAFTGTGEIVRVEISENGGKRWRTARLMPPHPRGGWREFELDLEIKQNKTYRVLSRATDSQGNTQPMTHTWNPAGYLRNAVGESQFVVASAQAVSGYQTYKSRCLVCHTSGIIESQPLGKDGWKKTLQKMKHFGVQLDSEEEAAVLEFLLQLKKKKTVTSSVSTYEEQKNRFQLPSGALKKNISTGQQIYEKNCASCHGIEGQGKIGPRLRARLIPKDSFFNVIAQGRNSMPAFRETLDGDQLEALWSFLQRPLTSENN